MIPNQEQADKRNPEEFALWALRNLPAFGGQGMVTHSGFLRNWSKHLWDCAFFHRDYLVELADEDGNINVSQLRKQTIKFRPAVRGPHHQWNNAAGWVPIDTPAAAPMRLQDMSKLTIQEQHVQAQQLRDLGIIPTEVQRPTLAEELK